MPLFNHILLPGSTETLPFTSVNQGRTKVVPRTDLDPAVHGPALKKEFTNAVTEFTEGEDIDFVYLVFKSPKDFLLDLEKLDKNQCRLASHRLISETDDGGNAHKIYEATVSLNKKAISKFLKKLKEYAEERTPITYEKDGITVKGGNKPLHNSLFANIDQIRAATLRSFWQEPELLFPELNESVWWEVWFSRSDETQSNELVPILDQLVEAGIQIGEKSLVFPENIVLLIKGTPKQLSSSLLYTDALSELRKPRETADFFTGMDRTEQAGWIDDLVARVDHRGEEHAVSVCLLDTGVNILNPLLSPLIPETHLDTVNPAWSKMDTHVEGHGTMMAGVALYGDLIEPMSSANPVQILHHLESIKLIERNYPHAPENYGSITIEAVNRAAVMHAGFKRMVCMAVTTKGKHYGRPSAWSAAIDQIVYGDPENLNTNLLFFISSGNTPIEVRKYYPLSNKDHTVEDPAQSFNSITVGAYTLKDQIDLLKYPQTTALAPRGGMSPCNTTSHEWDSDWCKKPDIVFEGGNQGLLDGEANDPESLQLLTTAKGGIGRPWLKTFSETSASTALAARFAAELYCYYPALWPETIRALLIHSADWTSAMLQNRSIEELSADDKEKLFSTVGYGVPNMQRARYSANNSLSLIAQRTLHPFKYEKSVVKSDEFHLFDLPWPKDILAGLFDTIVTFKITLSYFIEPNPGTRQLEKSASYRSHGLRFKMIDAQEGIEKFKGRVSASMREKNAEQPFQNEGQEHWILGERIRNKGSIHKDIWKGTAVDLAERNKIAVYPIGGWWKTRKKHKRYIQNISYSLVITIETPSEETDIYTPVAQLIEI
jgi:hypothetical protein